jgi:RNA polymerase sigma-70 factor, ECF subfamily
VREIILNTEQSESEEKSLIEAAKKDPVHFAELYERHFHRIYAFIAKRVQDRNEVQDLTSDVFHSALANLRKFEWRGTPFAAWLYRIAANAIADHFQRQAKEEGNPQAAPESWEIDVAESEDRARLYKIVDDLPAEQHRIITMRFTDQKSIREIARELQRTEGAIKQLQFRALKNLRARMGETNG